MKMKLTAEWTEGLIGADIKAGNFGVSKSEVIVHLIIGTEVGIVAQRR